MISHVSWTIGRIEMDARKVLVLGVLAVLAVGVVVMSGPVPRVQAADFDFAADIETKLNASDAAAFDHFGGSVSVSGDTAVVGAHLNDDGGSASGSAYVFVRIGGVWSEVKKLTASDAARRDEFGTSVSVSGDTLVVGARGAKIEGFPAPGLAYVFERNEGGADNWGEVKKLTASDAAVGDAFGGSVSVSGDTVVVGARGDDDDGPDSGSAYVFERSGGVWSEVEKLTALDAARNDSFGDSVSVSGDTVVVGATGNDSFSGSAYVFVRSGGVWSQVQKLKADDAEPSDTFGRSVSVSGDTVVVGVRGASITGQFLGSAYVFVRSGGVWSQEAKLTASDTAGADRFGDSVSVSGDTVMVGAHADDDDGSISGSVYVFEAPLTGHALIQESIDTVQASLDALELGNLDEPVSSRATQTSVDDLSTLVTNETNQIDADISTLSGKVTTETDEIDTALGMVEAKLDAQADAIAELTALLEGLIADLPQLNSNAGGKNK